VSKHLLEKLEEMGDEEVTRELVRGEEIIPTTF
jgi:hypothetical protein